MRRFLLFSLLLTILWGPAGCGSAPVEESPPPPQVERPLDFTLAELLARPRAELAGLADEEQTQARKREELYHQGQLTFLQLPEVRLPFVVPGLGEARFSPD